MPFPLHWHTEPLLVGGLLSVGWLYALFIWPFRQWWVEMDAALGDACTSTSNYRRRIFSKVVFFYTGLSVTYLALGSPLDQLGEDCLFSVHMVQHLILALLVPFLIYRGIPQGLLDKFLQKKSIRFIFLRLMHPACAALSFTVIYGFWHIPALYEWALVDKRVHIFEHCLMILAAFQVFWPLLGISRSIPRPNPPLRIIYILFLMVGQFPILGALTLSEDPLYTTYLLAPKIVSWSVLQDQILGGVLMNGTMMIVFFCFFAHSFYSWFKES